MDHLKNENCLVLEQKVLFDRSWKLKWLSAHSELLLYGFKSICSRTKYAIIKKIEVDAILSTSFWNFEKSIPFLFIIVVEKPHNKSYRAMQYLQNEISTSILCQIEPDL